MLRTATAAVIAVAALTSTAAYAENPGLHQQAKLQQILQSQTAPAAQTQKTPTGTTSLTAGTSAGQERIKTETGVQRLLRQHKEDLRFRGR